MSELLIASRCPSLRVSVGYDQETGHFHAKVSLVMPGSRQDAPLLDTRQNQDGGLSDLKELEKAIAPFADLPLPAARALAFEKQGLATASQATQDYRDPATRQRDDTHKRRIGLIEALASPSPPAAFALRQALIESKFVENDIDAAQVVRSLKERPKDTALFLDQELRDDLVRGAVKRSNLPSGISKTIRDTLTNFDDPRALEAAEAAIRAGRLAGFVDRLAAPQHRTTTSLPATLAAAKAEAGLLDPEGQAKKDLEARGVIVFDRGSRTSPSDRFIGLSPLEDGRYAVIKGKDLATVSRAVRTATLDPREADAIATGFDAGLAYLRQQTSPGSAVVGQHDLAASERLTTQGVTLLRTPNQDGKLEWLAMTPTRDGGWAATRAPHLASLLPRVTSVAAQPGALHGRSADDALATLQARLPGSHLAAKPITDAPLRPIPQSAASDDTIILRPTKMVGDSLRAALTRNASNPAGLADVARRLDRQMAADAGSSLGLTRLPPGTKPEPGDVALSPRGLAHLIAPAEERGGTPLTLATPSAAFLRLATPETARPAVQAQPSQTTTYQPPLMATYRRAAASGR